MKRRGDGRMRRGYEVWVENKAGKGDVSVGVQRQMVICGSKRRHDRDNGME